MKILMVNYSNMPLLPILFYFLPVHVSTARHLVVKIDNLRDDPSDFTPSDVENEDDEKNK